MLCVGVYGPVQALRGTGTDFYSGKQAVNTRRRIDQFHLMKKIGSGYASTVYLATCRTTGNQVAVKLYHKSKLSELNHFQVSREVRIHGVLDHKHIVQLVSDSKTQ